MWTSSGHFVVAYGYDQKYVYINDPNSTRKDRECNLMSTWLNEVKYAWRIKKPVPKVVDDEVVEQKVINIFGKDYTADVIFKDGRNYISPKVFENAGFVVANDGAKPIIKSNEIPMEINGTDKAIDGFNSGGSTYCRLRQFAEMLDLKVGWENGKVTIESPEGKPREK